MKNILKYYSYMFLFLGFYTAFSPEMRQYPIADIVPAAALFFAIGLNRWRM